MKTTHLLFCDGVGALIELDLREITSGDYGQIYDAFAEQAGFRREAWVEIQKLYPDDSLGGVFWDMELAGQGGASYRLHILPGVSEDAENLCRAHVRRSFDCVRMLTNRIDRLIDFKFPVLDHANI